MIAYLDVDYTDPGSGETEPYDAGWDGRLIREPEPVAPDVEAELRSHARTVLARVGWPPEVPDDYDMERTA